MNQQARVLIDQTRAAIADMTRLDRADLLEQLTRAVYDHVKLRVPGGDDSDEGFGLAAVLTAATDNHDQARAARFRRPPGNPQQQLLDQLLDQACDEYPTADWVITVPEELGAALPLDGHQLSRRGHGGLPGYYDVDVYRGFQLEADLVVKPVAIISDITGAAPSRYLNLDTGQTGANMAEIGLLGPPEEAPQPDGPGPSGA